MPVLRDIFILTISGYVIAAACLLVALYYRGCEIRAENRRRDDRAYLVGVIREQARHSAALYAENTRLRRILESRAVGYPPPPAPYPSGAVTIPLPNVKMEV